MSIFMHLKDQIDPHDIFVYISGDTNDKIKQLELLSCIIISVVFTIIFFIVYKINYAINQDKQQFNKYYRELIVKKAFATQFPNVTYLSHNDSFTDKIIKANLIQIGHTCRTFESNDYIKTTYKNVTFEYSNVLIVSETTSKHIPIINFNGSWFIVNLNKNVNSPIKGNSVGTTAHFKSNILNNYNLVELEDAEFNKKIQVYAKDETAAFYILTPQMMEKLKQLSDYFHDELLFCFIEDKLHIAFNSGVSILEPDYYLPIDEASMKKVSLNVYTEMQIIMDIIDILQQDNSYFKNENK